MGQDGAKCGRLLAVPLVVRFVVLVLALALPFSARSEESAHFTAELRGKAAPDAARAVLEVAEVVRERVQRDAGLEGPSRLRVVVYGEGVEGPAHGASFEGGVIHVSLAGEDLVDRLAHEYAHALVWHVSSDRAPRWLDEGIAMEFAGTPRAGANARVAAAKDGGRLLAMRELEQGWDRDRDLSYDQALVATKLLTQRFGRGRVVDLLRALKSQDFQGAFEAVFSRSVDRFDSEFRESL
jgi:hypothetical protein